MIEIKATIDEANREITIFAKSPRIEAHLKKLSYTRKMSYYGNVWKTTAKNAYQSYFNIPYRANVYLTNGIGYDFDFTGSPDINLSFLMLEGLGDGIEVTMAYRTTPQKIEANLSNAVRRFVLDNFPDKSRKITAKITKTTRMR